MRLAVLPLALWLAACTTPALPWKAAVTVDRYRGVYSTHFDGIPDQARVCAVITNRGMAPVNWVRLRLRSESGLGEVRASWTSKWIYRRGLEPGETVALELDTPPIANHLEITVERVGRGRGPMYGRRLITAAGCSETQMQVSLQRDLAYRTAPGIQILPMVRPRDRSQEVLVATQ